jgi:hypothetical protein
MKMSFMRQVACVGRLEIGVNVRPENLKVGDKLRELAVLGRIILK